MEAPRPETDLLSGAERPAAEGIMRRYERTGPCWARRGRGGGTLCLPCKGIHWGA